MKVSEVISELNRLANGEDPEVVVSVGSAHKAYPVTYERIFQLNRYTGHEIRLQISLSSEFVIRENKKK